MRLQLLDIRGHRGKGYIFAKSSLRENLFLGGCLGNSGLDFIIIYNDSMSQNQDQYFLDLFTTVIGTLNEP